MGQANVFVFIFFFNDRFVHSMRICAIYVERFLNAIPLLWMVIPQVLAMILLTFYKEFFYNMLECLSNGNTNT